MHFLDFRRYGNSASALLNRDGILSRNAHDRYETDRFGGRVGLHRLVFWTEATYPLGNMGHQLRIHRNNLRLSLAGNRRCDQGRHRESKDVEHRITNCVDSCGLFSLAQDGKKTHFEQVAMFCRTEVTFRQPFYSEAKRIWIFRRLFCRSASYSHVLKRGRGWG